jgi:glycine/sarcosine N-methyltransferase
VGAAGQALIAPRERTPLETESFYEALAPRHRLFYSDWPGLVRREGTWLDAVLAPGGRHVLDCTCGIGTQAIALALRGYDVTATDLGAANLEEARGAAEALGARVVWRQADVRRLDEAGLQGPFDAVVSLGNSLPHLLTEDDLALALRQARDQLRPGGLLLVGQRDWDEIAARRPRFVLRQDHRDTPGPGQRTILFDLWHYEEDPIVTFEVFFLQQGPDGWRAEVFPVRYRMWLRRELRELVARAGFTDLREVDCDWETRLVAKR